VTKTFRFWEQRELENQSTEPSKSSKTVAGNNATKKNFSVGLLAIMLGPEIKGELADQA